MIRRTFQHIPGVGAWREKDLWARGIMTWDDFPGGGEGVAISRKADPAAREAIEGLRGALAQRDLATMARRIPVREHWRLYGEFSDEALFFDIEAVGRKEHVPTVVSTFGPAGLRSFIQGRNLEELPAHLAEHRFWVTFNGSVFDVPVLEEYFGKLATPALHLDLRFLCQRLALAGGLKGIEDVLGLSRPLHLRGVNGFDAVLLWRAYQARGDVTALRLLVEYNLYDAFQLRAVVDRLYNKAVEALSYDQERRPTFERGDILYDVSRLLLEISPTEHDLRLLERLRAEQEAVTG